MENRINNPSDMFAETEGMNLMKVSEPHSLIAGYLVTAFAADGPKNQKDNQQYESELDEIKAEFDDIWLQLQLFWDLMLRIQPNCITSDVEYTGQAVAYLLDLCIARLLLDTRHDYDPKTTWFQTKGFRRRLRRLELLLRTDLKICGNSASMFCICMVAVRRSKHKRNIWTRVLSSRREEKASHSGHRMYGLRDVVCLVRLEDFLSRKSAEFNSQLNTRTPHDMSVFVHAAIESMEDEIKLCLKTQNHATVDDLNDDWVQVLSNPFFRAGVVHEVMNIVNEALVFSKRFGTSSHREGCEFWALKSNIVQRLTFKGARSFAF
ncbi:hypothetical protein ACHAPU_002461 [Fusarium lateritium]